MYQRHEISFTHYFLQVSRPFFATLHKWLFSGELYDPFEEFFVSADSSLGHVPYVHPSSIPGVISTAPNNGGLGGGLHDTDNFLELRVNGQKLWETKYRFRKEMLPAFVGESFGKKVPLDSDSTRQFLMSRIDLFDREKSELHSL